MKVISLQHGSVGGTMFGIGDTKADERMVVDRLAFAHSYQYVFHALSLLSSPLRRGYQLQRGSPSKLQS